ncbi:MAG: 50S ribosomal protein L13 [Lachnospiraceae bacterium]|nr:50S ribosomal protein L13 [Candidatus Hippenecus merdae]MCQ2415736.1 50S ribosomal protein L13 [Lachnospiraceae bacterium]
MTSYMPKASEIERKWFVIDAEGKNLGRLASEVAMILRGKKKPTYTPFIDCGDYVIIVNAEKFAVTGGKMDKKTYFRHSDYVGGAKTTTLKELVAKHPTQAVEHAVRGMLPKGALGNQMYKKLFVYAGPEHTHAAQKPEKYDF